MSLIGQPVTVIGGGVAGLAVARAMALRGAEVTVQEQAEALGEVGAGLQICPTGCVLRALGLARGAGGRGDEGRGGAAARRPTGRASCGSTWRGFGRGRAITSCIARPDRAFAEGCCGGGRDLAPVAADRGGRSCRARTLRSRAGGEGWRRSGDRGGWAPFRDAGRAERGGAAVLHRAGRLARAGPRDPGAAPVAQVFMGPGRHLVSYPLRGGLAEHRGGRGAREVGRGKLDPRDDPLTCGWPSRDSRRACGAGWTGSRPLALGAVPAPGGRSLDRSMGRACDPGRCRASDAAVPCARGEHGAGGCLGAGRHAGPHARRRKGLPPIRRCASRDRADRRGGQWQCAGLSSVVPAADVGHTGLRLWAGVAPARC